MQQGFKLDYYSSMLLRVNNEENTPMQGRINLYMFLEDYPHAQENYIADQSINVVWRKQRRIHSKAAKSL